MLGADLRASDFQDADLSQADLAFSWMQGAQLQSANLNNANLNGVLLTKANLRFANLNSAKMAVVCLDGSNLEGATLVRTNLRDSSLDETDFSQANLNRACLVGSSLSGANLVDVNLSGANLLHASLQDSNLTEAKLIRTYLSYADVRGANLSGADLSGTDLSGVNLLEASELGESRYGKNQGMTLQMEEMLFRRGASILPDQYAVENIEQSVRFEIGRRLDEVRLDLESRFLDLEESWHTLNVAIACLEQSHSDASELASLGESQQQYLGALIIQLKADIDEFMSVGIAPRKANLELFLNNTGNEVLRHWLMGGFREELVAIHESVCQLSQHTQLVVKIWQAMAEEDGYEDAA